MLIRTPTIRLQKMHWLDDQKNHIHQLTQIHFGTIIIGGSVAAGPRDDKFSRCRIIVPQINQLLKIFTSTYDFIDFLKPTKDQLKYNRDLINKLLWTDHLHLSKFGNKKFVSLIFTLLQLYKIVPTYPKLVPASSVVCKSFILSQRVCEVDPPCYVTVDVSTVKNGKYSPSCYNVTSVTHVKVCNFFVSSQMVCEVIPTHADVVHVTTNATRSIGMKYPFVDLGFFLHQLCVLKMLVHMSTNLI